MFREKDPADLAVSRIIPLLIRWTSLNRVELRDTGDLYRNLSGGLFRKQLGGTAECRVISRNDEGPVPGFRGIPFGESATFQN